MTQEKKKLTTGSLFGGLLKRGIQKIELDPSVAPELHELLGAVKEACRPDDWEEPQEGEPVIEVVSEVSAEGIK